MNKRPFDVVTENALKSLNKSNENIGNNLKKIDEIFVWIFGFSITGASLIVSNIANLNFRFESSVIKTILIILCISIISGILYRISALFYVTRYQYILFYLEAAFTKDEMMRLEATIVDNIDIHKLHRKIKSDFGTDYSDIIERYSLASSQEDKDKLSNYLKREYIGLAKWAKEEYEYSVNYVKEIYGEAFSFNSKKVDKVFRSKNHGFYLKLWGTLSTLFFIVSILAFISVLLVLVVYY